MRVRVPFIVLAVLALAGGAVHGQDFGVLESAATIDGGRVRLLAGPMLILGEDGGESELGATLRAGYGLGKSVDAEAKVALYDGLTLAGAEVQYWAVRGKKLNLALIGGLHLAMGSESQLIPDTKGVDLTALASFDLSKSLDAYAAVDFALDTISDAPEGGDDSFNTLHLVPGIRYALTKNLDLVAEFGLGLNDDAANYVGGALSYQFR